jgi:cell wall assembly regulator SMI1
VNNLWNRIKNSLQELKAQDVLNDLNPGAKSTDIAKLTDQFDEREISDLISYLRIHDGQDGRFALVYPWQLLSVSSIESERDLMINTFANGESEDEIEAIGPVKPALWNDNWLPFASDGAGNLLCIDLDPADNGHVGQVIQWAADPPYVEVLASGLQAWLETFAEGLDQGLYQWISGKDAWSRKEF